MEEKTWLGIDKRPLTDEFHRTMDNSTTPSSGWIGLAFQITMAFCPRQALHASASPSRRCPLPMETHRLVTVSFHLRHVCKMALPRAGWLATSGCDNAAPPTHAHAHTRPGVQAHALAVVLILTEKMRMQGFGWRSAAVPGGPASISSATTGHLWPGQATR